MLKLDSNLNLIDWFTPGVWATLDNNDRDLSSSGPLLIPGTELLTGGGKDGNLYLWQTENLGKYNAKDAQVVQKLPPPATPGVIPYVFSGPVFWPRSPAQGGSLLFDVYNSYPIYAYAFNGSTYNPNPVSLSSAGEAAGTGYNNSIALSANGDAAGSGIIWELQNNPTTKISILRAFDAENLNNELWNSQAYMSDSLQGGTTYIPPLISNGKVYAPTLNNYLVVYGLSTDLINLAPVANQNSAYGKPVNLTIIANAPDGGQLVYSATGLPTGLSINPSTGVISGTPTYIGKYQPTITVTDSSVTDRKVQQSVVFNWVISFGLIKS